MIPCSDLTECLYYGSDNKISPCCHLAGNEKIAHRVYLDGIPALVQDFQQSNSQADLNNEICKNCTSYRTSATRTAQIALGNNCNLACDICGGTLSTTYAKYHGEEIIFTTAEIKDYSIFDNYDSILFIGGEPLLYQNEMLEFFAQTSKVFTSINIITNGTLKFKAKLLRVLNERAEAVSLTYSLDSFSERNNELRKGSDFTQICKNMEYHSDKFVNLSTTVNTVLQSGNIGELRDMATDYEFFKRYKVDNWTPTRNYQIDGSFSMPEVSPDFEDGLNTIRHLMDIVDDSQVSKSFYENLKYYAKLLKDHYLKGEIMAHTKAVTIASAGEETFYTLAGVAMLSLLEQTAKVDFDLIWYVEDFELARKFDIPNVILKPLRRMTKRHKGIDEKVVEEMHYPSFLAEYHQVCGASFYGAITENYEQILAIDSDVIFQCDVQELFTREQLKDYRYSAHHGFYDVETQGLVSNGGVILINNNAPVDESLLDFDAWYDSLDKKEDLCSGFALNWEEEFLSYTWGEGACFVLERAYNYFYTPRDDIKVVGEKWYYHARGLARGAKILHLMPCRPFYEMGDRVGWDFFPPEIFMTNYLRFKSSLVPFNNYQEETMKSCVLHCRKLPRSQSF